MRFIYTDEMISFLAKWWPELYLDDLTKAFNKEFGTRKTESQLRATIKNHKLKTGKAKFAKGKRCRLFNAYQIDFIKEKYRHNPKSEMVKLIKGQFGIKITESQFVSFVKNHKIKCGRTGQFQKKHKPHNTGTKGVMKPNKTCFKKGEKPHNWLPVGTHRINSMGIREVKTAEPKTWTPLALITWEKANGQKPEGYVLRHIDGDPLNCDLNNLELVDRQLHLAYNRANVNRYPGELKDAIKTVCKLEVSTSQKQEQLQ